MNESLIIEGPRAIFFAGPAEVVDHAHETAWAAPHVNVRPDFGWVLGRFVESDNANENGHIFELGDLRDAYPTIEMAPLNMLHRQHHVVGAFKKAEMLYPTGDGPKAKAQIMAAAAAAGIEPDMAVERALAEARELSPVANPYVEALAAFWKYAFPDEYRAVMDAHKQGSCWYSMECVPEQLRCPKCPEENAVYAYAGPRSDSYCAHLNEHAAPRALVKPHFVGGAMVIPPIMPGWKKADIKTVANEIIEHHQNSDEAERIYEHVAASASHLGPKQWEFMMAMLLAGVFGPVPEKAKAATKPAPSGKLRGQIAPPHILECFKDAFELLDVEAPGDLTRTARAPFPGGDIWLLAADTGEWFFVDDFESSECWWVAQKWEKGDQFNVLDALGISDADAKKIGWDDQKWIDLLIDGLGDLLPKLRTGKGKDRTPHVKH